MLTVVRIIVMLFSMIVAGGCTGDTSREGKSPQAKSSFEITTTTGMISDLVSNLAGNSIPVTPLIASGIDPHLYKPTRSDISRMIRSSLVVTNGLLLEGKMSHAFERLPRHGVSLLELGQVLPRELLLEPQGYDSQFDPHIWMDPVIWKATIPLVKNTLSELLPSHAPEIERRAEKYAAELDRLNAYAHRVLETVPPEARVLITAHDAFQYFGKRYGYRVMGIQGISTESEAGIRHIEQLVDLLVQQKIKAVFIESTVPDRSVQALLEGTAAQGHQVAIGGELFSDAMGAAGTYLGTYIGMIDHNVTTITRALGGVAPAEGLHGKLEPATASEGR